MRNNQSEDIHRKIWNEIYRKESISQDIQQDIPEIVKIFKDKNVKRVLDLACGSGRHVLYLAKNEFEVYGIDFSEEGIKSAISLLQEKNIQANLIVGSMFEKLPYENDFFDALISIRSLYHGTIENIRNAIQEIERVLKPNGFIFITVRKKIPNEMRLPFRIVAPQTYIPLEGKEKGVIHYLFNKNSLLNEFKGFKIHKFWIASGPKEWEAYYCLLGELKGNY
ncbi:MAG: class I SAM-dependent methyltransferase [Promethearchaeota archaeon]